MSFIVIEIGCAECIGNFRPADEDQQLARVVGSGFTDEESALDSLNLPAATRAAFYRMNDGNLAFNESQGGYLIINVSTSRA